MNNKQKLTIIVLAFVLLIGSAYVLYTRLGESLTPDQLTVQSEQNRNETANTNKRTTQKKPLPKKSWPRILPHMMAKEIRYTCQTTLVNPSS